MTTVKDVKLMALSDLAELCKKLAEEPALTKNLCLKAQEFARKYDSLPSRGANTGAERYEEETLLIEIARFLPDVAQDEGEDDAEDIGAA